MGWVGGGGERERATRTRQQQATSSSFYLRLCLSAPSCLLSLFPESLVLTSPTAHLLCNSLCPCCFPPYWHPNPPNERGRKGEPNRAFFRSRQPATPRFTLSSIELISPFSLCHFLLHSSCARGTISLCLVARQTPCLPSVPLRTGHACETSERAPLCHSYGGLSSSPSFLPAAA